VCALIVRPAATRVPGDDSRDSSPRRSRAARRAARLIPRFSAGRMLRDYVTTLYTPAPHGRSG
jgi:hypothetical protein